MSRSITPQSSSPSGTPKADISGNKLKKFNNGWIKEQETLLADWSDIAQCYRWMHDRSFKLYNFRTLGMSIPVIVLSTLTGAASVSIGSIMADNPVNQKWAQIGIGACSLFTGVLQTLSGTFGFAQLSEGHRVAGVSWGKLQRKIAVELQLHPHDRMDPMDFLNLSRQELDRLIEQSPAIPESIIKAFDKEFDRDVKLKQPDVCGGIERTKIFNNNKTLLTNAATEATLQLKLKKRLLRQDILPDIDSLIQTVIDTRYKQNFTKIRPYSGDSATIPIADELLQNTIGGVKNPFLVASQDAPTLPNELNVEEKP